MAYVIRLRDTKVITCEFEVFVVFIEIFRIKWWCCCYKVTPWMFFFLNQFFFLQSLLFCSYQYMKSAQIRSHFWSVFLVFGRKSLYIVQVRETTDQKKVRILTLFAQWLCLEDLWFVLHFCKISLKQKKNNAKFL